MQDTLSEGTARPTQLAPSAVTASAVGGSATWLSRPEGWPESVITPLVITLPQPLALVLKP